MIVFENMYVYVCVYMHVSIYLVILFLCVGLYKDQASKKHLSCAAVGGPGGAHRIHQNFQR